MSDFINRKILIRKLEAWDCKSHGIPNYAWRVIREMPTADVRENKHAEWIKDDEECFCSNCKSTLPCYVLAMFYNFCPTCGADMRKPPIWHEKLKEYGNEVMRGLQEGLHEGLKGDKE